MKKVIFFGMIVTLVIVSCAQEEKSPIEGNWQVVSWERIRGDTLAFNLPGTITGSEMKIWSKTHFAFVGRYKSDTIFNDNYGGGTYKLDGNKYEESLSYPSQTTVRLLLEIKNDTVITSWPVDENWQVDRSNYNIQKLTRLE